MIQCRNCRNNKLSKIINLGKQVISSLFYKSPRYKLPKYSLDLYICKKCKLVQLGKVAPLKNMYGTTYGYRTSLSPLMIKHIKDKFDYLKNKKFFSENSNILDIGSNDGTFLNNFSNYSKNLNLIGIDPSAEKFRKYYNNNINLIIDFFPQGLSRLKSKIKFDIISSFAMFYDIEDPNNFCKQIKNSLNKDGIWILEMSYFPMLLQNLTYDQICHEHVTYYTLDVFKKIAKKNGLKILDFNFNEINGGSIEITCAKNNSKHKAKNKKIKELINKELKITNEDYKKFQIRIDNIKDNVNNTLSLIKSSKNIQVIGYGASTKGNIVLNHCGIDSNKLKYIADANPEKLNKFTPGTNIKIISKKLMRSKKPDYLFVLIWSFRKEVIKQELNYLKAGGKLYFHLPIPHIVSKENYKKYLNNDFSSLSYSLN